MKNIILYGFMGTGKTTVGRMLATKSGSAFIDTDAEIVKRQGMSIPDIFATRGEEYFRQCEAELVQELAGKRGTIISTGGGTMRNPANVAALHGSGIVVYLVADVDTILARTQKQGERPPGQVKQKVIHIISSLSSAWVSMLFYLQRGYQPGRAGALGQVSLLEKMRGK